MQTTSIISVFYHHPIQILSFFSLLMALCSLWIKKTFWIWGSFGFISLVGAFSSGLLTTIAFVPLAFFVLLLWGLQLDIRGFNRFLLASTVFLLGGALFFHIMPGFLDQAALPYPLCLNYGKTFVGLALLAWVVPTINFSTVSSKTLKLILVAALIGTGLLTLFSFLLHPHSWHFNFLLSFFPWAIMSLLFLIIPEEALLRGFLQKELVEWLGGGVKAQMCSVAITTLVYPLFHLMWAGDLALLIPTLAAGLTYAILYQITKIVETSIICHFLVGCIHFLFFGHLPLFPELPCLGFGF